MDPKVWATDPRVASDVVNPDGAFLPALLFFANARAWSRHAGGVCREDAELLASACDAVFAGHRNPAVMNPSSEEATFDAATVVRVRRRCVEAAKFALAALAKPQFTRFWGGTIATADGRRVEVAPSLAQTVLRVTDPWAWGAGAGGARSAEAALREVCESGGMKTLAEAIEMHLPEGGAAARGGPPHAPATTPATRAAVEELACALCERVAQSRADAHARPDLTLAARVFGVKNVWRRLTAGGAAERSAPVLWAYAVDTLHERGIDSLPDETVGDTSDWHFHKRADAGFHLGNLAEAAPAGLARFARSNPEGRWRVAVRFAAVASALLEKLPPGASIRGAGDASADAMQIDGGGGSGDADERFSDDDDDDDDDEAEHRAARRRHAAKHSSRTDGRSYPPLRREVTRQLATLCSADAYNALVAAALPGEGAWPSATYPAPAFGSSGGVPAFGSTAATAPAFGSAVAAGPARGSTGDPLDPARAAEIGLRTVSEFVVAASSRLRASDRGDVMRSLAFGGFVNAAWTVLGRMQARRAWPVVGGGAIRGERPGFEGSRETLGTTRSMNEAWVTSLGVFAEAYGTFLLTGDDEEFRDGRPLPASEFPNLVACLRDSLWHILWVESDPDLSHATPGPSSAARQSRGPVARSLARALAQLHDRNGRLRLVPPDDFIATEFRGGSLGSDGAVEAFLAEATKRGRRTRAKELLRRAPSLVPFGARVRWFKAEVLRDREEHAGRGAMVESWGLAPEHHIQINRGRVFDDALAALGPAVLSGDQATWRREHPDERPPGSLKGIVRVQFTNEHGVEEAGVDGGGLFKDFLNDLIAEAFDPVKTGLFAETPDRTLYPNPASVRRCGPDHLRKLEFLGAMLGKAVYEGILVDLPLAGFFLAKLRDGRPPELNDLATLDPELYHHLLSLKRLPPDQVEDLFLHFTATDAATGGDRELAPGGSDVRVTAANRTRYVHLMAHHLLYQQVRQQSDAFVRGFRALVAPRWLRVFAPAELRLLIAGAGGRIDVDDLARSATYSGGYGPDHPTVVALWQAVNEFTEEEQRDLLRFVTACPNTPLLGFGQLTPPFCVHRSGMMGGSRGSEEDADTARLPTAATCMNLLKLPPYRTKEQVQKKLLYAIKSGSGFDLS